MDISEAELIWIMGGLLLLAFVLGYRPLVSALLLLRQQRALGRLYWLVRTMLDALRR